MASILLDDKASMKSKLKSHLRKVLNAGDVYRFFNWYTRSKAAIFMLHRLQDPSIGYVSPRLTAARLDRCLAYLNKNNYRVLSFYDLIKSVLQGDRLYKTVCFTSDDGYIDFKNVAFPVFKKYGAPATVFITTDFINGNLMMWRDKVEYLFESTKKNNLKIDSGDNEIVFSLESQEDKRRASLILISYFKSLSFKKLLKSVENLSKMLDVPIPDTPPKCYSALRWSDIREMEKDHIDFQPHTVNHPILSKIDYSEQVWQIKKSKEAIRERLKSDPVIFCYPNGLIGDFTEETVSILKDTQFLASCIAELGFFYPSTDDLFRIPRIPFPKNYNDFVYHVSGCKSFQLAVANLF